MQTNLLYGNHSELENNLFFFLYSLDTINSFTQTWGRHNMVTVVAAAATATATAAMLLVVVVVACAFPRLYLKRERKRAAQPFAFVRSFWISPIMTIYVRNDLGTIMLTDCTAV